MRKTYALCALALMVVAGNAFALGEARVQGKITDAGTHAPIPNAVITLDAISGHNVHSQFKGDKDGNFRFIVLDGTLNYKVTYTAPGYAPLEQASVKFTLGEVNNRDVTMVPAGSATAGSKTGAPVTSKADPAVLAYNEGAELANAGKLPEAIAKLEEAVAAKPDLTAGYEALAKLYLRTKNYDKAIDRANKVLEIDTDNQDMFHVLSESYTAKGDKTKAAEYKKKLPADASAMFNDAAHLINTGKDAEAEPLLKGAIAANDKFEEAYYELGMLYARTQKNAEARANLQKFLDLAGPVPSTTEIETKCKTDGDTTKCTSILKRRGENVATAKEMLNYVK